jgi:hypothetical protein
MLERVAAGQSRFVLPGLALDSRGVALGRQVALFFVGLDGLVGTLRALGDGGHLGERLAELAIVRVRSRQGGHGFVLLMPAHDSTEVDRAARAARLFAGRTFTGGTRHFVRYRDERAPFGYDVVQLGDSQAELVLHDDAGDEPLTREGDVSLAQLVTRLSLVRMPGGDRLDAEARGRLLLTVPAGLGSGVIGYLWRHRVAARVARVALGERGAFMPADAPDGGFLIEAHDLPERILASFLATPGIVIYRPVTERLAVEVGYRHPLDLGPCAALWSAEATVLFSGRHDAVWVLGGPVELVDARHLVPVPGASGEGGALTHSGQLTSAAGQTLDLRLELAPSTQPPRRVAGALIPTEALGQLKQLVFALPPASLAGHAMVVTDRGVLVIARDHTDAIPLGTLLAEAAPGLLVPLGMELTPRVAPDVLAQALGHQSGCVTVFPPAGEPFQLAAASLVPLERKALAAAPVAAAHPIDVSLGAEVAPPTVVSQPLGAFALWGFPAPAAAPER